MCFSAVRYERRGLTTTTYDSDVGHERVAVTHRENGRTMVTAGTLK